MTEELFREDSYLKEAQAHVKAVVALGDGAQGVVLDRTIFYPLGGGQPGDTGYLVSESDESRIRFDIVDTRKNNREESGGILHMLAADSPVPEPGSKVMLHIDWERRYRHMRMHSCMHLVSAILPYPVTGGQVGAESGRLDFDIPEPISDKESLSDMLGKLIREDHPVTSRWISAEELQASPGLVKTMSVAPPLGAGKVRLIEIDGCDLQPCGGTHVRSSSEIGAVAIRKIEKKGMHNRRVRLAFL